MNVSNFLAFRYLRNSPDNFIYIITRLTFLGIFVASLSVTLTIMFSSGFDKAIKKNLQGLSADGMILKNDVKFNRPFYLRLSKIRQKLFVEEFSPTSVNQVIIREENSYQTVYFSGVYPDKYSVVTDIANKVVASEGGASFVELLSSYRVIVGVKLAKRYGLQVGQQLSILLPTLKGKKVFLKEKKVVIGAIISVGFDEYDSSLIIGSMNLFKELFGEAEADAILIKIRQPQVFENLFRGLWGSFYQRFSWLFPFDFLDPNYTAIKNLSNYYPQGSVVHWKEVSPSLLSSMRMEQFMILLIILLILFVAVVNIVSLLFMKVQSKQKDIAILLSLGMPASDIKNLFIKVGLFMSLFATAFGEMVAFGIGYVASNYSLITLPDVYMVQKLPVNMGLEIFAFVFLLINLTVYLACRIPTRLIDKLNISFILRH